MKMTNYADDCIHLKACRRLSKIYKKEEDAIKTLAPLMKVLLEVIMFWQKSQQITQEVKLDLSEVGMTNMTFTQTVILKI